MALTCYLDPMRAVCPKSSKIDFPQLNLEYRKMQAAQNLGYEVGTVLYIAMELSKRSWNLGFSNGQRHRRKSIEARNRGNAGAMLGPQCWRQCWTMLGQALCDGGGNAGTGTLGNAGTGTLRRWDRHGDPALLPIFTRNLRPI